MSTDSPNDFANQFIASWQENFAKAIQDQEIMQQLIKAMGFMQQFYEKPFTNSAPSTHQHGADQYDGQQLMGRIQKLEARIAKLESKPNRASGKKKTK